MTGPITSIARMKPRSEIPRPYTHRQTPNRNKFVFTLLGNKIIKAFIVLWSKYYESMRVNYRFQSWAITIFLMFLYTFLSLLQGTRKEQALVAARVVRGVRFILFILAMDSVVNLLEYAMYEHNWTFNPWLYGMSSWLCYSERSKYPKY